jgi:hypothetical protein
LSEQQKRRLALLREEIWKLEWSEDEARCRELARLIIDIADTLLGRHESPSTRRG